MRTKNDGNICLAQERHQLNIIYPSGAGLQGVVPHHSTMAGAADQWVSEQKA